MQQNFWKLFFYFTIFGKNDFALAQTFLFIVLKVANLVYAWVGWRPVYTQREREKRRKPRGFAVLIQNGFPRKTAICLFWIKTPSFAYANYHNAQIIIYKDGLSVTAKSTILWKLQPMKNIASDKLWEYFNWRHSKKPGCWSRTNSEGAPALELFAILSLLRLQLQSRLKRAAPHREYSDWYRLLVLLRHYTPPIVSSINILSK